MTVEKRFRRKVVPQGQRLGEHRVAAIQPRPQNQAQRGRPRGDVAQAAAHADRDVKLSGDGQAQGFPAEVTQRPKGRQRFSGAACPGATCLSRLARRFAFVLLALSKCRNPGVRRIILPVAVILKRLATDFLVFCMVKCLSCAGHAGADLTMSPGIVRAVPNPHPARGRAGQVPRSQKQGYHTSLPSPPSPSTAAPQTTAQGLFCGLVEPEGEGRRGCMG